MQFFPHLQFANMRFLKILKYKQFFSKLQEILTRKLFKSYHSNDKLHFLKSFFLVTMIKTNAITVLHAIAAS